MTVSVAVNVRQPVSRLVCVVPQRGELVANSAGNEARAGGRRSDHRWPGYGRLDRKPSSAIAEGLRFCGERSDPTLDRRPAQVQLAITNCHDWISNELLARDVALGELPVRQQAARHQLDLDGSVVQIALTKEL